MSSTTRDARSSTLGIVVKFESPEKSFGSAATDTDGRLGLERHLGRLEVLVADHEALADVVARRRRSITYSSSMRSSRSISCANILRMNRPRWLRE